MSHLTPPKTFREWTGSVVGWYGLLAPEIMEVLEASPSKPSVSSVVLMVKNWTLDHKSYNVKAHNDNTPRVYLEAQVTSQRAHFCSMQAGSGRRKQTRQSTFS